MQDRGHCVCVRWWLAGHALAPQSQTQRNVGASADAGRAREVAAAAVGDELFPAVALQAKAVAQREYDPATDRWRPHLRRCRSARPPRRVNNKIYALAGSHRPSTKAGVGFRTSMTAGDNWHLHHAGSRASVRSPCSTASFTSSADAVSIA